MTQDKNEELRKTQSSLRKIYRKIREEITDLKKLLKEINQTVEINEIGLRLDFRINKIGSWRFTRIIEKRKNKSIIYRVYICKTLSLLKIGKPILLLIIEEERGQRQSTKIYAVNLVNNIVKLYLKNRKELLLTVFPLYMFKRPEYETVSNINVIQVGFISNTLHNCEISKEILEVVKRVNERVIKLLNLVERKSVLLTKKCKLLFGIKPSTAKFAVYGRLVPKYKIYSLLEKNRELLEKLKELEKKRADK